MPHPFKSIALVGNAKDSRVSDYMLTLAGHLFGRGLRALVDPRNGMGFPSDTVVQCPEASFASRADLIIAIGGDGTLLYAANLVAGHPVPLLGINRGRLGFLTDVGPDSMLQDVDSVLEGRYTEDRRSLLAARLERYGRPRHGRLRSTTWSSTSARPAAFWISRPRSTGASSTRMAATGW